MVEHRSLKAGVEGSSPSSSVMTTTHIVREDFCPDCGAKFSRAVGDERNDSVRQPEVGDFCICLYCANVSVYDENMVVRKSKVDDFKELDDASLEHLSGIQRRIVSMNLENEKSNSLKAKG